jgi:intron-binding protein aquarius
MSRSRLGLYVFGRASLFANCYELQPAFSQMLARPQQLALVPGEHYGHCTRELSAVPPAQLVSGVEHMGGIVQHMVRQWEEAASSWARSSAQQAGGDAAAAAAGAVEEAVQATAPAEALQVEAAEEEQQEGDGEEGDDGDEEGDGEDGSKAGDEEAAEEVDGTAMQE